MKIFQIILSLSAGGAEKFVVNLSNELLRLGQEVVVISLHGEEAKDEFNKQFLCSGVRYKCFGIEGRNILRILKDVNSYIRLESPDIIHCHLSVLQYLIPTVLFKKTKVFHTLHSLAQYANGGDGLHAMLYKYLYKTGAVTPITISEECHQSFLEYYNISCDKIINNGCKEARTTSQKEFVQKEIDNYKTSPNTKVFIHVARYHKAKNKSLLIDSFNELNSKGVDFVLLILGGGFDNIEAEQLIKKACNKIYFLGIKNNVGDYLSFSDAFCLTSIYEGLPISLLEAMSMNVVPICTPVGGIKSAIEDGKSGFLAKDVSVKSYVSAVLRFMNEWKGGLTPREVFKEHYSMELCAKKYLKLFEE